MRTAILIAALCFLAVRAPAGEVNYVPLVPPVTLPDGSQFLTWADETNYSKTYHVNRSHPRASDRNPGTEELPFLTINRAAQQVRAGERVWIHAGIYREIVEPRFAGEGPNRMIAYEAAPGEQAILKGSRLLHARWEPSRRAEGPARFSRRLWMATLPDSLFEGGYFPFRTPNATDVEFDLMEWALAWKGRLPYTLPRGLIFQDGRRMQQLATWEDLVRLPGSYWVAAGGQVVHIHPFGGGDPNGKTFEVAVQPHLIRPQSDGLGFLRVSGLTLEHCANGFLRTGVGALFTRGGNHWIIERNTVRQVNSVGIEFGFNSFEPRDKRFPQRQDPPAGHNIVRYNRVSECGTAGMRGFVLPQALVEYNEISDCGWQDAEYHWEVAGIKLLVNSGTLVRNNSIAGIVGGGGIWLDWDNRNSRVTGNLIRDISTAQAAVFVEASQQPNLVDHNVFWNIDGQGVRLADTDHCIVAHNLFGAIKEELVFARVATNRSLGGRRLTSQSNRVLNNIFLDADKPLAFAVPDNLADYNVYVSTRGEGGARALPGETHSLALKGEARLDASELVLTWSAAQSLPAAPLVKHCERDYAGRERIGQTTVPGPFLALEHPAAVRLWGGGARLW